MAEKEPNWSKSIFFSMIADSRDTKDIKGEIENLHKKVMTKLSDVNKFKVSHGDFDYMTFENGETQQYRVHYRVEINKNNTTKNELYGKVNSVKPVYYGTRWGD